MSLSGTQEGGALMMLDATNYSEQNTPATRSVPNSGGQRQATQQALSDGRGFSRFGRVTTPYPLWDGTNRVLASYRPCEVTRTVGANPPQMVACATLDRRRDRGAVAGQHDAQCAGAGRRRHAARQRAGVIRRLHVRSAAEHAADRRRAAGRLHVRGPGRAAVAPRAAGGAADPGRRHAGRAEHGADRSAQRLRHRRPEPHGQRDAGRHRGREAGVVRQHGHRADHAADRAERNAQLGGRPAPHQGSGGSGLSMCAGALRARDSRRGAAVQHDGRPRGDRRDRVRAAEDPRLRAGRTRWFVQAARAGGHAAGAGDRRRQGPRDPDPPELDPGAPRRAPHLRRLPQPAPWCVAELRPAGRPGQPPGRVAAEHGAEPGRDDGLDAHPPRPERAAAAGRHGVQRRVGQPGRWRCGACVAADPLHRQRQRRR